MEHLPAHNLHHRAPFARLPALQKGTERAQEALEAKKHPEIHFKLQSYEADPAAAAGSDGPVKLKAKGVLTVAGVQKPVALDLVAAKAGDGVRFTGSKLLRMTEFGITPPVMMLGALKTADEVVISFDLQLDDARAKEVPAVPAQPGA